MSEENKVEEKKVEVSRGDRGDVGQPSAGLTMLQRWREVAFHRENANSKQNPNKRIFVRIAGTPSLKQFARKLLKEGDAVAEEWFANKLGAKNQKRSDGNIKAAREAGSATKAKKREKASKKK